MARTLRILPGVKALAAAAVAALTLVPLGTAEAGASPMPATARAQTAAALAAITDGQHYVLAPQQAPDQWLGENNWDSIVAQPSRLWYGNQYHHALWTARDAGNGAVELQNYDFGGSLQDSGAVEANWGQGGTWDWIAVGGPGGTVALRNRVTNRFLALNAQNVAVMATGAFYWYLVNAHV
ncbi:hypothetical protein [Kitasatospora sp. NPDC001175]|uniref:hypothetical protein n=1 Tax=Kitasatospora sp. NPDC001175 TaxID=3157103 RepID=UPI003D009151